MFTIEIDGLTELAQALSVARDELMPDMADGCAVACDAAVAAMQASHPYQDRTYCLSGGMHTVQRTKLGRDGVEAQVQFVAPYAGILDSPDWLGGRFNFTQVGETAAAPVHEACISDALGRFCARVAG